ncbi:MAG: xanthine dehydrogenase family protein subunit M [Pseudorhodoplanes sp.]
MREFDYLEPNSIAEASEMLAAHPDDARMMAGGTALMLALRQRMVSPTHVISLRNLRELRGITYDDKLGLRVGALTKHAELARSPLARAHFPMLADMASRLANPQVRNQGTIGGNLCYADPATDPPTCLMALGAEIVLTSAKGSRVLPIEDFILDYYVTALGTDELVSEIRVPPSSFNAGYHARFLRTAAEHRPLVNLAVAMKKSGEVCDDLRMVAGASTAKPTRLKQAENYLKGKSVTPRVAAEAADIGASEVEPISDLRGSAEFRREMLRVVARRTIGQLFGLSEGAEKSVA